MSSSYLTEKLSSGIFEYISDNLTDGDPSTCWVENVAGDGIGEWVMFEYHKSVKIQGLGIINGFTKDTELYYKNNRVKKIKLDFSDGTSKIVILNDNSMEYQEINFNKTIEANYIIVTILEVYKGNVYSDTCIVDIIIN